MADSLVSYQQTIKYPKTLWYGEPEFSFYVDRTQVSPSQLLTFVHIVVHSWSPSTFRRLKTLWPSVRQTLPHIVFASGDVCDEKWIKFIKRFGFMPILDACECTDDRIRPIYIHLVRKDDRTPV